MIFKFHRAVNSPIVSFYGLMDFLSQVRNPYKKLFICCYGKICSEFPTTGLEIKIANPGTFSTKLGVTVQCFSVVSQDPLELRSEVLCFYCL